MHLLFPCSRVRYSDRRYKGNNSWVDTALDTWVDFMEGKKARQPLGFSTKLSDDCTPDSRGGRRATSPDSPSAFSYCGPNTRLVPSSEHQQQLDSLEQLAAATAVESSKAKAPEVKLQPNAESEAALAEALAGMRADRSVSTV